MKAVVAVIGKDTVGIIANISTHCTEYNANVEEVTQSVLTGLFAMIMTVDISHLTTHYSEFAESLVTLGDRLGLSVHVMHQDIFDAMHRI